MKKIIEKHENLVCYLLIAIYVVVNSYCMQNFGLTDYRSAIINMVFSIVLVVLIISSKRVSYYGLTGVTNLKGYLYFINDNKRLEVHLTDELRQKVLFGIVEIFKIISESKMYPPKYKKSCPKCSLYEKCAPKNENINGYIKNMWEEIL